jgi:hypothetical protein
MTLKEQFERSRATVGATKSEGVIAALETKLGHVPTLKQKVEALRESIGAAGSAPQTSVVLAKFPQADITAAALCVEYDSLTSDEQRRAFWKRHEKTFSNPKAKVNGLALICMMAGIPFSNRARAAIAAPSVNDLATSLLEEYRLIENKKDREAFWRKHCQTLEKSKFCDGFFLNYIAAGKELRGSVLATFALLKETK